MLDTTLVPKKKRPIDWVNAAFITLTPVVAVVGTSLYVARHGVTWLELANFLAMFLLTGISITAGYHRYYAHRTYDCNKPLRLFYLVFGAAAVENSLLNWAADHRRHHQFVDSDEDPYNILKGGLYAHMGWIFFKNSRTPQVRYKNVPDLLKDPMVRWQHRWYLPLVILATFAVPTYIGLIQGRPTGGLLWGGFLRVVVVHHMTFFINSIAHLWGTRPYSQDNTARDNWWLGPLTFGEGYHNFHHAFQADYRNGVRWYHFDMGKWWIRSFAAVGWAWRLKRAPEPAILSARLKTEMQAIQLRFEASGLPATTREKIESYLRGGKETLEAALSRYHQARIDYRRQKDRWTEETRRQWSLKLAQYKSDFYLARAHWRERVRRIHRIPQPSAQGLVTLTALLDLLKTKFPSV